MRVVYFASARDLASTPKETLTLPDRACVKDLVDSVVGLHPGLKSLGRSAKYSVNFEVTTLDARLKEGDEVGVLPPVAGG